MSEALSALRARFISRCADDLRRLTALSRGDPQAADLQELAHSLAGAGGTFGFPALSEAAGRLDDSFALGVAPARADIDALRDALQRVVDAD